MTKWVWISLSLIALTAPPVVDEKLVVEPHQQPAPTELAPPIRALLADGGVRATVGKATIDLWLVKALTAKAGAPTWVNVTEGTLVGAARLSASYPDIRGRTINAGTFTLRLGMQPENGDHLGVSPFREFVLLSSASDDKNVKPLAHDPLVELSAKAIGIAHPAILSIDPPVATAGEVPRVQANEAGHQAVILKIPVTSAGKPAGELSFGLILIGFIDA